MTVGERLKTILVDAALILGLILAIGAVYSVETRLPRPQVAQIKEGYETKVVVEKGLSGTTERTTYVLRTKKDKAKWIAQYGGSPETEACVQAGLDWLVRHQSDDGFWSSECLGPKKAGAHSTCEDETCTGPGRNYVMSQTGLALLALQASGNYESNEERYSKNVARGIDWLIANQQADGGLMGPLSRHGDQFEHTHMYEHAMAAFALAEACAVRKAQDLPDAPRLKDAAIKAIGFIERHQHNDGGWRYTADVQERSDCSVSGWAMLALKSAREAGIPVSQDTIDQTRYFFKSCQTADGRTSYQSGMAPGSDAITAVGMLTHLLLLKDPKAPLVGTSAAHLANEANNYRDHIRSGVAEFYTLYNANLAMYQRGGDEWNRWNDAVRDAVVGLQVRGSHCDRGSWDPAHTFGGDQGGRIYSTALATLTLEVYYRFSREGG